MATPNVELVKSDERIGGSGVVLFGGTLYNMQDYNPDLRGQRAMEIYDEMLVDSEIAAGMSRLIWPLLSAQWEIKPVDDSDEEIEIAEFCEKWIMGKGRLDPFAPRWQDTLRHAFLCLGFGFSAFEKVWGTDEQGRQVYARIEGILPKSVEDFQFATDGTGAFESLHQYAYTDRGFLRTEIPSEKLILISFARKANDFWGQPIIRACYKPWYHEDKLTRVDGMRHERHGLGFTSITVPAGAGDAVMDAAETIVREARAHERGFAVLQEGQELDIAYPTGQGTDVIGSIKHHNNQKAQVLFSEFMHLGSSESGSRATSASKMDFMLAALQGLATLWEETINAQAIPDLVGSNWGARAAYPTLECEDLSKLSGIAMAETLEKLMPSGEGAITWNPSLEKQTREAYQLPEIPEDVYELMLEAERVTAKKKLEALTAPPAPSVPPGSPPPASSGAAASTGTAADGTVPEASSSGGAAAVPVAASESAARLSRSPSPVEAFFAAAETSVFLDEEPKRIWYRVVAPYRSQQIDRMAKAAPGVSDEDFANGKLGKVPFWGRLNSDLAAALESVYARGRLAVLAERRRQLAGEPVAAFTMQEEDEDDVEPTKEEKAWVARIAETFVAGMVGALVGAGVDALKNARNADLGRADQERMVREAMNALSIAVQQADLGGAVVQTYTNGRNEQAKAISEEIATAFYSAILDTNTCDPCAALDGAEHEPDDATFATPNPSCEGGDRCRCITIYVFREAAAAA